MYADLSQSIQTIEELDTCRCMGLTHFVGTCHLNVVGFGRGLWEWAVGVGSGHGLWAWALGVGSGRGQDRSRGWSTPHRVQALSSGRKNQSAMLSPLPLCRMNVDVATLSTNCSDQGMTTGCGSPSSNAPLGGGYG